MGDGRTLPLIKVYRMSLISAGSILLNSTFTTVHFVVFCFLSFSPVLFAPFSVIPNKVITIYTPMIYTAPCIRFLMQADRLRGEVGWGGGLALEIESFVGPCEIAWAHKTQDFQHQPPSPPPPPTSPCNLSDTSKTLRAGPYKSLVHRWFYEHENVLIVLWAPPQ